MHCTSSHCKEHAYQIWSHLSLWWQSFVPDKKTSIKINQRRVIKNMEYSRVMVLVHCTSSHCQKHAYQVWSHLNLWWQIGLGWYSHYRYTIDTDVNWYVSIRSSCCIDTDDCDSRINNDFFGTKTTCICCTLDFHTLQ